MTDTIDLLEAIGSDASLRHASSEELSKALEQAHASEALAAAVTSGDRTELSKELGHKPTYAPQISQVPAHEGDDLDHDHDRDHKPHQPPAPDHDKPSPQR
jgi:hypothetical protein